MICGYLINNIAPERISKPHYEAEIRIAVDMAATLAHRMNNLHVADGGTALRIPTSTCNPEIWIKMTGAEPPSQTAPALVSVGDSAAMFIITIGFTQGSDHDKRWCQFGGTSSDNRTSVQIGDAVIISGVNAVLYPSSERYIRAKFIEHDVDKMRARAWHPFTREEIDAAAQRI